jgi:hypothetical protein
VVALAQSQAKLVVIELSAGAPCPVSLHRADRAASGRQTSTNREPEVLSGHVGLALGQRKQYAIAIV